MTQEQFQHIAPGIPTQPGIYKYFSEDGILIYVGKAKHLRKRVSSYFTKTFTSYKTHELVQRIARIEFAIVNSEQDAFLLENSLIKEHQPKYNINLKDDKTYPFIVIKNENFPRVFLTRQKRMDGSEYLGPYTSVKRVRELLDFIKQTIQLRTCSLNLSEANIKKGKYKVCLEYHLGNCKGPCESFQTEDSYDEELQQLRNLLKGNLAPVIRKYREEMKGWASQMQFEKAELVRKKIEFIEQYQSRSVVANSNLGSVDVFSVLKEKNIAYVNFLMIRSGAIIQTKTSKVEIHLDESEEEILTFTATRIRKTFNSDAAEIIAPILFEPNEEGVVVTVPKGGDKKKLMELSIKNAQYFIDEIKNNERLKLNIKSATSHQLLENLQRLLQLRDLPVHIECFDNSNFQGSYPVSAMVCFKNGEPSKQDYRRFNVKTVEGINDFATMKEAVGRRYKRLLEEAKPFPQLVIIDGGKGQLGAALEALTALNIIGKMTIVGLAKNEEELFFAGDKNSLKLPYNSPELKLIRRIRDEVHRFGITFHRKKRSSGTFKNELESIKGIGSSIAAQLLQEFRSVKNIKQLSKAELVKSIGESRAQLVYQHFHSSQKE
jgi:excinuclease ABC subunit C